MIILLLILLVASLIGWTRHARMLRAALNRAWDWHDVAEYERVTTRGWLRTTVRIARSLRADRDRISAELDLAYSATAEVAWARRDAADCLAHVRRVLTETRQILAGGDARALESTADLARQLVAERDRLRSAFRCHADAHELIATIEADLTDPAGDASARPEWRRGWDAALREYGEPAVAALRSAMVEIDAITSDRDSIAARAAELERSEETQSAIIDGAADAIKELGNDCVRRDAAIDAMTRRIEELLRGRAAAGVELTNGELLDVADAVQRGGAVLPAKDLAP